MKNVPIHFTSVRNKFQLIFFETRIVKKNQLWKVGAQCRLALV